MSRSIILCVAALLAAGCVAAEVGDGEEAGLEDIDYQVDNGIFMSNGMNLGNGIDIANGMNLGNGIYAPPAGSALEQWIDADPVMRTKILRYLVECALPAGVEVELDYRGQKAVLGRGMLGLGPGLQRGPMSAAEQERVSSCLLSRVNAQGIPVSIDVFAPVSGLDSAGSAELAVYEVSEAAFFGNLFLPTPQAYACGIGSSIMRAEELRACEGGCGVLRPIMTLNKYGGTGATSLRQCFISGTCTYRSLGDSAYLAASCTYGGRSWSYPMTTRMMSAGAGEQCFGTYQCEYGLTCSAGRCQ